MKDRLLTSALAVGALLVFAYFFIGPAGHRGDEVSRPVSTEARDNGYLGARRWIESHGVPVLDLRQRFHELPKDPSLPERGNLLVTTIPYGRDARPWEFDSLREWVEQGNTLLVLGGMFDTPEWAVPDRNTLRDLRETAGLQFASPDVPEEEPEAEAEPDGRDEPAGADAERDTAPAAVFGPPKRLDEPARGALVRVGAHPLTAGVTAVATVSEYPAGKFLALTPPDAAMLALMNDRESGLGAFWLTWAGEGTIVASGYGSIFTNKLLGEADNARLLANLVAAYVAPGGRVIFDDIHQGAASLYDAEAFFADSRLHASLWWIGGLWLLWVLGATRLPPPPARPQPVREEAFLALTGNFFARVLDRRRTAERLLANFAAGLRGRGPGAPAEAPWQWLHSVATVDAALLARVERARHRVGAGRRVDLAALHNDLQLLWKQLQ